MYIVRRNVVRTNKVCNENKSEIFSSRSKYFKDDLCRYFIVFGKRLVFLWLITWKCMLQMNDDKTLINWAGIDNFFLEKYIKND